MKTRPATVLCQISIEIGRKREDNFFLFTAKDMIYVFLEIMFFGFFCRKKRRKTKIFHFPK